MTVKWCEAYPPRADRVYLVRYDDTGTAVRWEEYMLVDGSPIGPALRQWHVAAPVAVQEREGA